MSSTPPMPPERDRQATWTRYWASIPASAASGSFAGGYGGTAIASWWQRQFATVGRGRRWLDLATGNGAVPRLWLEGGDDPGAEFDAVDLADIHVPWVQALPAARQRRVQWHSGVSIEALPFDGGRFDVVTSQYGVEYTELARSVEESARVLAPRGAIRWMLHHASGRPVRLARAEMAHIEQLLQPDGLWTLAQDMIEPIAKLATPAGREALALSAEANRIRQSFDTAQARTSAEAQVSPCPDVLQETQDAIAAVLQRSVQAGPAAARELAGRWKRHLADSRLRLAELVRHALSVDDIDALRSRLDGLGFSATVEPLAEGPHLMAWTLAADRQA